jgi:citrate synthase
MRLGNLGSLLGPKHGRAAVLAMAGFAALSSDVSSGKASDSCSCSGISSLFISA